MRRRVFVLRRLPSRLYTLITSRHPSCGTFLRAGLVLFPRRALVTTNGSTLFTVAVTRKINRNMSRWNESYYVNSFLLLCCEGRRATPRWGGFCSSRSIKSHLEIRLPSHDDDYVLIREDCVSLTMEVTQFCSRSL